jgi:hypothetical protein
MRLKSLKSLKFKIRKKAPVLIHAIDDMYWGGNNHQTYM